MIANKNLETVLVKAPHRRETYSDQELLEFARCADPVTGPAYFMDNFFNIQHPTQGKMLYRAFGYQKRLIETYNNYRFSISMMPRQSGKCVVGKTIISVCNNNTGVIYDLPIEKFYEYEAAKRNETLSSPDISCYIRKDM